MLREKLGEPGYQAFIQSVFMSAWQIAHASGGSWFNRSKVSDEEARALQLIASVYDVDLDAVMSG